MRYLNENLIRESFLRLRQNETGGKTGLERTSALMCFLAFDALLKRTSMTPPLDFDPEVSIGNTNRAGLTREFARLVQLKNGSDPRHVLNLGEVTIGGNSPEKRFSSNFLTTGMKKATTSENVFEYPSRPCPLIVLGPKATKLIWGMDRHTAWQENLPTFLVGRKTKTPFHDLACFVLRQRGFISEATSLQEGLMDGLAEVFTKELCDYWKSKLSLEKPYFAAVENPFQDSPSNAFEDYSWADSNDQSGGANGLAERVTYLEGLLKMHHISFEEAK